MRSPATPPLSRMLSWLLGCIVAAWVIVYNAMRVTGSNPSDAALPSLGIGVVGGAAVFGLGLLALRRLAAAGRVVTPGPVEIPGPSQLAPAQRDAMNMAWPALGALAAVALAMGFYLSADWLGEDPATRAKTTVVLAAWNLLAGLWLGDEALRLRTGEAEGIEAISLGCGLTAVLAGVGLSRGLAEPGQAVLIVVAGIAGPLTGIAVWRLRGARGIPLGAGVVLVVAALSLVLPLVL